jgi:hypothetical protein
MKKLILAAVIGVTLLSCGPSTKIVKSWVEPGATVTVTPETHTLVISLVKDETSRRVIEDQLVKKLAGKATASYTVLNSETLKQANEEALNQLVAQGKYTHILLMRLADVEKKPLMCQVPPLVTMVVMEGIMDMALVCMVPLVIIPPTKIIL